MGVGPQVAGFDAADTEAAHLHVLDLNDARVLFVSRGRQRNHHRVLGAWMRVGGGEGGVMIMLCLKCGSPRTTTF